MVRDLMKNCRHLILFLVVQKILASLKLTTVFTVTTECTSQNGSEKKFQLLPGIIIILRRLKDLYILLAGQPGVARAFAELCSSFLASRSLNPQISGSPIDNFVKDGDGLRSCIFAGTTDV